MKCKQCGKELVATDDIYVFTHIKNGDNDSTYFHNRCYRKRLIQKIFFTIGVLLFGYLAGVLWL